MAVTGGDPLNSATRGWLGRALDGVRRTFARRPPTRQVSVEEASAHVVGSTLAHVQQQRSARGESPPAVAGAGWVGTLDPILRTDAEQQALFGSEAAKYGRATTAAGMTPQAWATQSGVDITLERIAEIHREVDTQGFLYRKADLDFAILRKDSHLKTQQRARAAAVYRSKLQLRPADASPLARAVCGFVRTVIDQIDGFSGAEEAMLLAAAYGYSGLEVVWRRPRDLAVRVGKRTVTVRGARGIASLEWVHPRDFRWSPIRRKMLLDMGGTRLVDPFRNDDGSPTHKLILHTGDAGPDPHQSGYMFAAEPLHMLKHQSVGRWAVTLELLGIQTPYMQLESADSDGNISDEDFAAAQAFLGTLGRGRPALLDKKLGKVELTPAPQGVDARGQHMAFAGFVNSEMSKLVMGQTLSAEAGGAGSYALANVQADSKEDVWIIDAQRVSDTHSAQTVRYIVECNAYALARAFGASPEQICAVAPRAFRALDRRIDPVARLGIFVTAKKELLLNIDPQQVAEELNLRLLDDGQAEEIELPESQPEQDEIDDSDEPEEIEPTIEPA